MVDVAQDVVISEDDCMTSQGLWVGALKDGEEVIEPLADRIVGRVVQEEALDADGNVVVAAGDLLEEEDANRVAQAGIEEVVFPADLSIPERWNEDFDIAMSMMKEAGVRVRQI